MRESKSIALQKSSNFSKIFFILRIVLLAFIWSEKRGIELSFQIRVLFLKKSLFFRRESFCEKSKPIALQKFFIFFKIFFSSKTVLLAFIRSEIRRIDFSFKIRVLFLKKSQHFRRKNFWEKSKPIALQKSSNFSKKFSLFKIVLLPFMWSEKRGSELSFQLRVLFLKKSQLFRRGHFWEKIKPIALQKTSNFSKIFFILRIVLLAFIWSEKRRFVLSFKIRVLFLKNHFFQTGQFLREK